MLSGNSHDISPAEIFRFFFLTVLSTVVFGKYYFGDFFGGESLSDSPVQATCDTVKSFIDETLGHYLVNVTTAATLCSRALCSSQGRCQRRNPGSRAYLHLDPASWKVVSEKTPEGGRSYRVLGGMRTRELTLMTSEFKCQCYPGWGGESCTKPTPG